MYKEGDRVVHPTYGAGKVEESDENETRIDLDKTNEDGHYRVKVETKILRYETALEEYESMYCDICGGTACHH